MDEHGDVIQRGRCDRSVPREKWSLGHGSIERENSCGNVTSDLCLLLLRRLDGKLEQDAGTEGERSGEVDREIGASTEVAVCGELFEGLLPGDHHRGTVAVQLFVKLTHWSERIVLRNRGPE